MGGGQPKALQEFSHDGPESSVQTETASRWPLTDNETDNQVGVQGGISKDCWYLFEDSGLMLPYG